LIRFRIHSPSLNAFIIVVHRFCSGNPPPQTFFLSGNVAVVVAYASSSNSRGGSFSLNWDGSSFDPLGTNHVSSLSGLSSGAIKYPVIGQYETSLAATWNINTLSEQTRSDFILESIRLQSCANVDDPCTCDALILYQISADGVLIEDQRFCSDASNINLIDVGSQFVLAFFTDSQTQSNNGVGFQAIYYPSENTRPTTTPTTTTTTQITTSTTTTTTTTAPTTTEKPSSNPLPTLSIHCAENN
jgi:hypothetical protein